MIDAQHNGGFRYHNINRCADQHRLPHRVCIQADAALSARSCAGLTAQCITTAYLPSLGT